jgi:transcriptional regulator with XRE-family HTH domain
MANKILFVGTGHRLKKVRELLNYTRRQMAGFMGVTISTYYKNENYGTFPCLESLILLFEKHDISIDWFMFGKGPMQFKKERNRVRDLEQELETLREKVIKMEKVEREPRPEVEELVEHMERIPLLRHELLRVFHRFKLDNRELVDPPAEQPLD